MKIREIEKLPQAPPLSKITIQLLTELCFRQDDISIPAIDCIFIFGSDVSLPELAESVKHTLGYGAKKMVITGGIEAYQDSPRVILPEAESIFSTIKESIPKNMTVFLERRSQNTYENVHFGLAIAGQMDSLCFIAKSYHSGRAYLTLKKASTAKLFQRTFNPLYPPSNACFKADNWHTYPEFTNRVWGEFLRIKKYGERGDLYFREVRALVSKIETSLSI